MDNQKRIDNLMKVYSLDGGILHESLKDGIMNNDLDKCTIINNVGIDKNLKHMLNMLLDDIKREISVPM